MAEPKTSSPPYWQYGLLFAGVGAVVYFATRPRPAVAGVPNTTLTPTTGTATTTTPSAPRSIPTFTPPPPSGLGSEPALIARLRGGDQARRIYYLQSLLYSAGMTDVPPDGLAGPVTASWVRDINQRAGFPNDPTTVTDAVLARLPLAVSEIQGPNLTYRVVPQRLPQDVIDLVNATARRAYPVAVLLQAQAS